jgi:hypothetical protein
MKKVETEAVAANDRPPGNINGEGDYAYSLSISE